MGRCTPEDYLKWLEGRAVAHVRRDRKRDHAAATRKNYMVAIHAAVIRSGGVDDYTGEELAWENISNPLLTLIESLSGSNDLGAEIVGSHE